MAEQTNNRSTSADHLQPINEDHLNLSKMNKKFVINLTKNSLNTIADSDKRNCRIINFVSEWTIDEIINEVLGLNARIFRSLICIFIKLADLNIYKNILDALKRFCDNRQLIIYLASAKSNEDKIFYTTENTNDWIEIIRQDMRQQVDKIEHFSSFFRWLETKKYADLNQLVNEMCKVLDNPDQLILRFLTSLDIAPESHFKLISHCAENYSKQQFLAALGIPFSGDERFLDENQSRYIRTTFTISKKSVLESAIQNKNGEVFKYLTTYCSVLVQKLPPLYQQKIAKQLILESKFEIYCDLLDLCDFRFPSDITYGSIKEAAESNERLNMIIEKRKKIHEAIEQVKMDEIKNFIKSSDLKLVNNIQNNTVLYTALRTKKFELYVYLKSLGFKENDCKILLRNLSKREKLQLKKASDNLMNKNIKGLASDENKAVYMLAARSKIFGKHSQEDREKIRIWLEDIWRVKYGSSLLSVAAQCDRLIIIFDFESANVERVDLDSPDADGIMYPGKKLIIVAAKHSTEEQQQKIKACLAHELFHYVMRLAFENDDYPYLNEHDERYKVYSRIVERYERIFSSNQDDECDGIISAVFRLYEDEDQFHAELIVRPIQILVRFENDKVKVDQLVSRYKDLFDFIDERLVSFMDGIDLRQREVVRLFNESVGMLSNLSSKSLEFSANKEIEEVIKKNVVVAHSDVPKLLHLQFYNYLKEKHGNLVDTMCIFIGEKLESVKYEFIEVLEVVNDLKVFIDFSSRNYNIFEFLPCSTNFNLIFIASSQMQSEQLLEQLKDKLGGTSNPEELKIGYKWKDLKKEAQEKLLSTTVNFQSNPSIKIGALLESLEDIELLNTILQDLKISINSKKELEDHFDQIFRKRKFIWNKQSITVEDLLKTTRKEKVVLISDVAGTGKSWAMRNISKELCRLYPTKWLTFVDLKQWIPSFEEWKRRPYVADFHDFLLNEILKDKSKIEIEVFKLKYRTGNSLIFLDGFDEITLDHSDFVMLLMKSFTSYSNSSNYSQLWISTRDFFEVDLSQELNIRLKCKLEKFNPDDGIDLISIMWRLYDLRRKEAFDFEKEVTKSKEIEEYKEVVRKICFQMPINNLDGIGQPLIYKMIAEVTKQNRTIFMEEKFCSYQLFKEFWKIAYDEWSKNKGKIRAEKNFETQESDLNFVKLHQLKALQKFIPGKLKYCDMDVSANKEIWSDNELVGCGLITKSGENYFFIHETFGEFFVVQFIIRILCKPNVNDFANVFEFIKEAVLNPKHEVIRMLLNEALATEDKIKNKIEEKAKKIARNAEKFENLYEILTKTSRNWNELGNLWFFILKHRDHDELIEILSKNVKDLISNYGSVVSENLQRIFVELFTSIIDVPTIESITAKLAEEMHPTLVQKVLNYSNDFDENFFVVLLKTRTLNERKFEKLVKIFDKFLTRAEIGEKLMSCSKSGESLLHYCVRSQNVQNMKTFWTGLERTLSAENFKKLLMQQTTDIGETILHHASFHPKLVEVHETLFNLLLTTFEGRKTELKSFMLCQNVQNNNFLFPMVHVNNSLVLEYTLNKLIETFSRDEVRYFLKTRGFMNNNLLQHAARYSVKLNTHQSLWAFLSKMFEPKEVLEFFLETDTYGLNIFHLLIRFSTTEFLNFYIQELEKLVSKEEIRRVLCCLNDFGQNILHYAALYNDKLEVHKKLWETLRNHFDYSEIVKFLSFQDYQRNNILKIPRIYKSKEIIEFTQTEIIREIMKNSQNEREAVENLEIVMKNKRDNPQLAQKENLNILSLNWVNRGTSSFANKKDIDKLATNPIKNIHKESWKDLLKNFEESKSMQILMEKNIFGDSFVHEVLRNENLEVIKLTFENIKENFSAEALKEILHSTNSNGTNLLQFSACGADDISAYEYLWEFMKSVFNANEIYEMLMQKDRLGNNLLLHVAKFGYGDVAEYTWNQIEEIFEKGDEKLQNQINERSAYGENILHVCVRYSYGDNKKLDVFWMKVEKNFEVKSDFQIFIKQDTLSEQKPLLHRMAQFCEDLECHKTVWKFLISTFIDKNELKNFVLSQDRGSYNFLFKLIRFNNPNVIRFTFETLRETFDPSQFNEILTATGLNNCNLFHHALRYIMRREIHEILWENFSSCESFSDVLAGIHSNGWSLLNSTTRYSTKEILDFMREKLVELKGKVDTKKIVLSGQNLMIFAASNNFNLDFHKSLWNFVRTFLDEADILLLINSLTADGYNMLQKAVRFNSKEIVEDTWKEIKSSLKADIKIANYLGKINGEGLGLIGIATKYNRPAEIIDFVSTFIEKTQRQNNEISTQIVS